MLEFREKSRDGAQSVRRSLVILDLLAAAPIAGLSLTEIARGAELSPPTARRILKVLIEFGAVEQRERSRRYMIGNRLPVWAAARPAHLRLVDAVQPFLDCASSDIGQATFLSCRTDLDATCLARTSLGKVRLVPLGSRRPLGMPACSWAMLAKMPDDQVDAIVARNGKRLHKCGIDATAIRKQLSETRRRGFAFRDHGHVTGLATVSLALRSPRLPKLAAITVVQLPELSGPGWVERAATFLHACDERIDRAAHG